MHQYNDRCLIVLISVCFAGSFVASNFSFFRPLCAVASPSPLSARLEWFVFALINQTYVMLRRSHPEPCVYTNLLFFPQRFDYSPLPKIKHGEDGKEQDEKIVMMISALQSRLIMDWK